MTILVLDIGTSSMRAAAVTPHGEIRAERRAATLPDTPFPGLVEFDALGMAELIVELASELASEVGPPSAVGIATQRASTVVWDRVTGEPVAPAIGWQDLRTVGECLVLRAEGFRFAPNHSATKIASILDQVDPDRTRDLCFGTVETWLVWYLSKGEAHVSDLSNASMTGLLSLDGSSWDEEALNRLGIPLSMMPALIDSAGHIASAPMLSGNPTITGLAGDQQASMVGQGCLVPGVMKATFGTGGMANIWLGSQRPSFESQGPNGTFPIVALRYKGEISWALEGIMLAAGTNIEWLRDDLGIIQNVEQSHEVAASCETADGVVYVPALVGLGTPHWDYGARGALFGLTRGSNRSHITRAVLEGVAQRGRELVDALSGDSDSSFASIRLDGGMSTNPTFVQAFANATGRPVEVAPVPESTTVGAALLAALGNGEFTGLEDVASLWQPREVVEPTGELDHAAWAKAVQRAAKWYPELTELAF